MDMQWEIESGNANNIINTVHEKSEIDIIKLFQQILVLLSEQTKNKSSGPNFEFCTDVTLLISLRPNNALNAGNDIDSSDPAVSAEQLLVNASQAKIRIIHGFCDEVIDIQSTSWGGFAG